MKALVLGGGSIKGAWEAGAVSAVIEKGFRPDMLVGISVGSLNSSFLVNAYDNDTGAESSAQSWPKAANTLLSFWKQNIKSPDALVKKNKAVKILSQILRKKFNGLYDTTPVDTLIDKVIDEEKLKQSGIKLFVGTVSLPKGDIIYASQYYNNFKQYIKASKAIPILMQQVHIGSNLFSDGGLIDSAPLKKAIDEGATEIVVIGNHPKEISPDAENMGDLMKFAERVMEIIVWNTLNNDIDGVANANECIKAGIPRYKDKKHIDMTVIRPLNAISVSITDFTGSDIKQMIESGYDEAKQQLDGMKFN